MDDEPNLDRRSFLQSASTVGLVGSFGMGNLRAFVRQEDDGDQGGGGEQDGQIDYFRAVLPVGEILDADLVYRIVVVGEQIRPGMRPPPECFPESQGQWYARDAVVVKPTETADFLDGNGAIGAVDRTRAYLERQVEPGSVYRIAGGEYCDGYAVATVHELPPRLSENFSTRMLDLVEEFERNETAGNGTVGTETARNRTTGDRTADGPTPSVETE